MADVEHYAADRTLNSGKGVHPQLGRSDVADASTREGLASSAADKGRFAWQTDDGTIWADDGVTGLWRPVTHPSAYGELYNPAQIAACAAYWPLDGDSLDAGPNSLDLTGGSASDFAVQGGQGLPQSDGRPPGTRQCLDAGNGYVGGPGEGTGPSLVGAADTGWDPLRILGAVTVQFWHHAAINQNLTQQTVISQGALATTGGSTENICYLVQLNAGNVLIAQENGSGTFTSFADAYDTQYLNNWIHYACVRAANGSDWTVYRNGMIRDEGSLTAPDGGSVTVTNVGHKDGGQKMRGNLCGVMVTAAALTSAEVNEHYYYGSKGR